MKIKVCGMKFPENIAEVTDLKPDYMGFILWEKSPRIFNGKISSLPKTIKKVGVFVDAPLSEIIEKVRAMSLDYIQLHGAETPEFCSRLKESLSTLDELKDSARNRVGIIKAIGVGNSFPFENLKPYEEVVEYFLFDTKGPLPGGNGFAFNWELLNSYTLQTPFFLSGGIGLNDLEKLKKFLDSPLASKCHAVDVNSAFEIEPGLKKKEALDAFIKKIKQ
jgi:phosphoribosylanthranilate isomerase